MNDKFLVSCGQIVKTKMFVVGNNLNLENIV